MGTEVSDTLRIVVDTNTIIKATHIISHDKDLLSLPNSRTDAGRRFRQRLPGVKVQDAATFVRENPRLFRA